MIFPGPTVLSCLSSISTPAREINSGGVSVGRQSPHCAERPDPRRLMAQIPPAKPRFWPLAVGIAILGLLVLWTILRFDPTWGAIR